MNADKHLIFFDDKGNSLNFNYNNQSNRYEGKLIFDHNSAGTFKTIGLNLFEKINAFEFIDPLNIGLDKMQLFNHNGILFNSNNNKFSNIEKIESINNDISFFSKWIYSDNIDNIYPIGSKFKFDSNIFEFNSSDIWTVISVKRGAIMIISNVDNNTFSALYSPVINLPSSYIGKTISGVNTISFNNYIDNSFNPVYPDWSEPTFFVKLLNDDKISVINTKYNDGVYTIKRKNIIDDIYSQYKLNGLLSNGDLRIDIKLKTDLPLIYSGGLSFNSSNSRIDFLSTITSYFKPGLQFQVINSSVNNIFLTVSDINIFNPLSYYVVGDQVLFNNKIYQCITNYTVVNINKTNPLDSTYWSVPDYIIVDEILNNEFLSSSETYLTSNIFTFITEYDTSEEITIASAYNKYKQDISNLGIDLYLENNNLYAKLRLPSIYAEVTYYSNNINVTTYLQSFSKILEIDENLVNEENIDISELFVRNIVINDIDDFGLRLIINKQEYYIDTDFVYNGLNLDLIQTVSNTIKDFISTHFFKLIQLGIVIEGVYSGVGNSPFVNTIRLSSVYPNIPIKYTLSVGSTANYYIKHSSVAFNNIGSVLNISINNKSYIQLFTTSISKTLENWIDKYKDILIEFGILVVNSNNTLHFNLLEDDIKIEYIIKVGKSNKPSIEPFTINRYYTGNLGVVIASNKVVLNTIISNDFESAGFSTGMLTNINNSDYPLNNQEYNILKLDPTDITLSYQGPFWGNTNSGTQSGFLAWGFSNGFGYDINSTFNITPSVASTYDINYLSITTSNDILYNDSNKSIYISSNLTNENFYNIDRFNNIESQTRSYINNSLNIIDNKYNSKLYYLYDNGFITLDPNSNTILSDIITGPVTNIACNSKNGDIYLVDSASFYNIYIYDSSNTLLLTNNTYYRPEYIVYNRIENKVIISTQDPAIIEFDGDNRTIINITILSSTTDTLYYNELNGRVYGCDGTFFSYYGGNIYYISGLVPFAKANFDISTDLGYMYVLTDNNVLYILDNNDNIVHQESMLYGDLSYSPYDRKMYCFSGTNALIYDTYNNVISTTISLPGTYSISEFSWGNNSVYAISKYNFNAIQISTNIPYIPATFSNPTYSILSDRYYGSLDSNYTFVDDIYLNTREFIRKPRYNYLDRFENSVSYKWIWDQDIIPEIFMFDFSGDQLPTSGSYKYTGPKPLDKIYLNTDPNKDITKTSLSEFQQTIFNQVIKPLSYIDSETDISFVPEPIQTFIGFTSDDEGVVSSTLLLKKVEDVQLDIIVNNINNNKIKLIHVEPFNETSYGLIELDNLSSIQFINQNLREGQIIKISLIDNQNEFGQYISQNSGKVFKIKNVYNRQIVLEYINDTIINESNVILEYPVDNTSTINNNITYLDFNITVQETELARIQIYGQTEIEDIRYKIELNNIGKNLMPEDAFIFKHHPIEEESTDWNILNNKRKEMLLSKGDIFNYIGSYKSIINAINLFGYNDLELYEYYKNIDFNSQNYGKLIKVEIPDIFDNTVEGWTEKDYLKIHVPNEKYDDTNLFNLTYKITDKLGNFVLGYSVQEASIKLAGLKKWLSKNIIPLTHKILDVTGRTDFVQTNYITHQSYDVCILNTKSSLTPIVGNITESYVLPINSGSTVYNVLVDLSHQESNNLPDYYNIEIKTYQNYPIWDVFKTYQVGDYVKYYDILYVSVLTNNKLNNPRKYLDIDVWSPNSDYLFGQVIEYNRRIYQYNIQIPQPDYNLDTLSGLSDPEDFIINDGKLYILNQSSDKLTIIDIETYLVTNTITINNSPIKILKNNINGYLYILGISDVVVFNTLSNTIIHTIILPFNSADDFVISSANGWIFIPLVNNDVLVYDFNNTLVTTYSLLDISNNAVYNNVDDTIIFGLADGTTITTIDGTGNYLYDTICGFNSTSGLEIKYNNTNNNTYYINSLGFLCKMNTSFNVVYPNIVVDYIIKSNGDIYIIDSLNNLVVIDINDITISINPLISKGIITLDEVSNVLYLSDSLTNNLYIYNLSTLELIKTLVLNDSATKIIYDSISSSVYGLINSTDNIFKVKLKNSNDNPYLNNDWNDITEWEKVDLRPVQVIKEYRDSSNLLPFNFTIDSNIDPFISLSVISDNGYGQIYSDRKYYEMYISEDASASIKSTEFIQDSNP